MSTEGWIRDSTDELVAGFRAALASGTMSEADFHRNMVIAARLYVIGDQAESGVALLFEVPLSYYRGQMRTDLEDPGFAAACTELIADLGARGYLVDDGLPPTPGARA
jgi:hypothetical protein